MKSRSMNAFLLPTQGAYHKYFSDEICDGLELIEADYGLKGFAIVIKLWQKIHGSNEGYYCRWNEKVCSLFAKNLGVGKGLVFEIVNRMIKDGIFDAELYERYGILTSEWLQQNWSEYMKRRTDVKIEERYLLLNYAQKSEIACKNKKNVRKNEKNAHKKSTTILDRTISDSILSDLTVDGILTLEQLQELAGLSSVESVGLYVEKIKRWQEKSGKAISAPFSVIKKWIAEDKARSQQREPSYDMTEVDEFAKFSMIEEDDQ